MSRTNPAHYWSTLDKDIWVLSNPSRRLRKLYKELDAVDAEIARARVEKYVPCHAPSDYQIRRRILQELSDKRDAVVKRIDLLQNDSEVMV